MARSTKPRTAIVKATSVTTALPARLLKSLDEWRKKEGMTRGEAMRWIIAEYFKKRTATGLIK